MTPSSISQLWRRSACRPSNEAEHQHGVNLAGRCLLVLLALMQSQRDHAAAEADGGQYERQERAHDQPIDGERHHQGAEHDGDSGIVGERLAAQHFRPIAGAGNGQTYLFARAERE
jgi:hypothetical protein